MSAPALLEELARLRVELWVEDGTRLRYRAPVGALTPEYLARLKQHKAEIIAALAAHASEPERIPRLPDAPSYALSQAQWRLWVLTQLENAAAAYRIPLHFELLGPVRREVVERVFMTLVARHEALRTSFTLVDGEPRQVVHPRLELAIGFADLSAAADPVGEARARGRAQTVRPFDLTRDPLLRVELLRLAPERHVVLFTLHHIIADGTSVGVLVREFSELYAAFAAGRENPLPPLRIHYRDYAAWQNTQLRAGGLEPQRRYWHDRLGGELPVLDLPTDRPRPAAPTFRGGELPFTLTRTQLDALRALAQRHQASLFMVLTALVKVLLHRHTGQNDIIVGSPIAGRTDPELEPQVGFYVNTLALRDRVEPGQTFAELLRAVRQTTLEAFDHSLYPFDFLVNELPLKRDLSRSPILDVMVVLQNQDERARPMNGVTLRSFLEPSDTAKLDLTFLFKAFDDRLQGAIEYNCDLYGADRIERMAAQFAVLADAVLADPGTAVGRLELLSGAERRQVVAEFQGAAGEWASGRTLVSWFEAQVAQTPDAIAVSGEGAALSYGELNARANRLAWRLRRAGVGPEARVGMYFERTVDLVVGIVAILKAGGAYVPFDPVYPAERIGFMLRDAAPRVLLTQQKHEAFCRGLVADGTELVCADDRSLVGERTDNLRVDVRPEQAAYVIYTSGSTGQPKGCVVEHRQVVRLFEATQAWYRFGREDVWTLFHSYAFDFSVWELWGALLYGGRLVVVPFETSRSPEAFLELLRQEKVTVLNQTPSAFRGLMAADESARPAPLSLRYVIFGGEALEPASLAPWWERHGDEQPQLVNMYGITETTVHVTYRPLRRADGENGSVIGRPIPDLRLYVLDAFQQPVPIGVVGEIYVGGAGVARGYLNRPELTAERFVPDRLGGRPGATLYRSGDLARWRADGELEYLGRADHQVKIRGFRIELGEIEAALASHPAVRSALVLLREERGDKSLAAYVVWRGEPVAPAVLRAHVGERVPEYMVPADIVGLAAFPLTPNGKVDRRALPAPDAAARVTAKAFVVPKTPAEIAVAAIWAEVLGVARVGAEDNFFELGGHSLKATQVVARLRASYGDVVTIADVFRCPTVASLAARVAAAPRTAPAPIAPATAEELEMLNE
ncbi:non-ribosomal peptide synthetase [Opitutus terrae]|uniref:Amino acid adenylation domain protein n=1 Tax=Opitutus terrae (strain DSM 11246 / JCM 15787 / PB90-1) TaxID=452637 RepID=B1ZYL7_OPITP|nr:non-ribosomal peptide synthetase [Opitutus terrae]ACB75253.1 amino acid adenylation domain protein [Opitutus terrae PB90-1]